MFTENHYVPVVKWKRGERIALENLNEQQLEKITPLIEVQPIPYDHQKKEFKRSIDKHLEQFGKELASFWKQSRPVFVDANTLFDDPRIDQEITLQNGQTPLEFIVDDIERNGIIAIPVTSVLRPSSFHDAVEACLKRYNRGLALRIEQDHMKDFEKFKKFISAWLEHYEITPEETDIILDFKEIDPVDSSLILDDICLLIAKFPHLNNWRSFTILSTSMTPNLSHITTGTNSEMERAEWEIYSNIIKRGLSRFPSYGDYNIGSPEWFDFDPTKMDRGANIKYTVNNRFLIFRGRGIRKNGFAQFRQLCIDTINHQEYCGQHFSYGDEYIYQCATDAQYSTGNSETWVRVCVNHHLAFVINQLATVPVSATV